MTTETSMSQVETAAAPARAVPEPLPAEIKSTQPGGGVCYRLELLWGRLAAVVPKNLQSRACAADARVAARRPDRLPA